MPTFSIDNDRTTLGVQDLAYDQSSGVQTQLTTDTGDEAAIALVAGELDAGNAGVNAFLAGLSLSTAQKDFAVLSAVASSESDFILVTADAGETLNDLKLIADPTVALTSMTALDGSLLYIHVDATGNYATIETDDGRIVGAIALTDEVIDNTTTHTATAGVKMVFFEGIAHTDTNSQDETVPLGDVLKVGADTAVSFNFEQLEAGNFLWACVGDAESAMLITGQDLNVTDNGPAAKIGNIDKGGSDPSDAVNTSKAADTTIGINAQHFAPTNTGDGATGVFTFVTGYQPLNSATPQYTGQNVKQIDYSNYLNVNSATVNISQLTGGSSAKIHFSFYEAGGGEGTAGVSGADHAVNDLSPEEGYSGSSSYIGDQGTDSHLTDDTDVNIATVEIDGFTWNYNDASNGTTQGGLTVTITGNDVVVLGATADDNIKFTAVNDPANPLDGTFNRINIQALQDSAAFDIGYISLDSGGLNTTGLGEHLFVDDDGPSIDPSDDATQPNDLEVANAVGATDSSFYYVDAGTDGLKSFAFVGPEDDSGDFQWTFDDASQSAITGTYKGVDLYSLSLNADGTYDIEMLSALPGTEVSLGSTIIHAGGPTDTVDVLVSGSDDGDFGRIIADSTVGAGLVNASHGFVGVDNGNLDNGESLNLSLHEADGDFIYFSGLTVGTKSAQACQYDVFVTMADGSVVQVEDNISIGKNGTLTVMDPDATDDVLIESVTMVKVDGNAIKIGLGGIEFIIPPEDVQLNFDVALTDGDDDVVTSSFLVDIDGDGDGLFEANVNALSVLPPEDFALQLDAMQTFHVAHHADYLM